jgi:hypothetical protein
MDISQYTNGNGHRLLLVESDAQLQVNALDLAQKYAAYSELLPTPKARDYLTRAIGLAKKAEAHGLVARLKAKLGTMGEN